MKSPASVYHSITFWGLLLTVTPAAWAQDGSGLQTSVAVDMVADTGTKPDSTASDRIGVREAELMLYGPIDHLFDGALSLAAHAGHEQSVFEIHEATVSSSKLIPRSRFRLGQFFLGVGRLNQLHRHDWPFISTPYVHERFFGSEGVLDSGLQYSVLLPLPFYLDVTLGVTNGYTYGHSHDAGEKPRVPTNYVRVATFFADTQLGLNYLNRKSSDDVAMALFGYDLVYKKRDGQTLVFLLQTEAWKQITTPAGSDKEESWGTYVYGQYGINRNWAFGVRGDYYTVETVEDAIGRELENYRAAVVPTITWKPSEFSTFRLAYEARKRYLEDQTDVEDFLVQGQATFILGAHPAHDF